jgi:PIN domain nuclease of toxin-antitoxin system
MRVLLDTHVFLWLIIGDGRLSRKAKQAFLEPKNRVYLSAVSFWEISIKMSLGKLSLKNGWVRLFEKEMKINTLQMLPIEITHCEQVSKLPFHHRDPFDRMLISQAMVEEMAIVTGDGQFSGYGIPLIW